MIKDGRNKFFKRGRGIGNGREAFVCLSGCAVTSQERDKKARVFFRGQMVCYIVT